jgi:ABC-2 type transport system permease protein
MSKISLVIGREFNERVRKRSFLVATILTPILFIGLIVGVVAFMTMYKGETKTVEVIDRSGIVAPGLENTRTIEYKTATRTLDEINASHPDTWGVLVIGPDILTDSSDVQLYSYSSSTVTIEAEIEGAVEKIVEAEKLKNYDIENLSQILDEVHTDVTMHAYTVDESGREEESSSMVAFGIAYALGFLMYIFVFAYGAQVMTGVIEEKNSKVLEVVVSSVRPFQLMMGKIIGIACVAITQFAIWVILIALGSAAVMHFLIPADIVSAAQGMTAGMSPEMMQGMASGMTVGGMSPDLVQSIATDNPELISALGNLMDFSYMAKLLVAFIFYFTGGYLLYAAMYAAVGSAVDNVQDSQQFQMPITLPLVVGFIGMFQAMQDPTSPVAFWLSLIPFTSPLVMMARIPYGVPAWELALSIGLLIATFIVMVWLAGKIYRVGIFMYGKKPTIKELAKWMTYKS